MSTSTLEKISNSSKEYFINGNFNSNNLSKNFDDYFCPEKKSFNKLLHSKSVSNNLKMKFNEFYKGFFQKENLNINKFDTSEIKKNLDNFKYKKVIKNFNNNQQKKFFNYNNNNFNNYNNNINLVVKRKLLYDYINREKKENLFNNENKLSRKLNRMNKINNENNNNNNNYKYNNSFILISNKVFGNENSFLVNRNNLKNNNNNNNNFNDNNNNNNINNNINNILINKGKKNLVLNKRNKQNYFRNKSSITLNDYSKYLKCNNNLSLLKTKLDFINYNNF